MRRIVGTVAIGCLMAILAACGQTSEAEDAVRRLMRDPDATQFRDVETCSADREVIRGDANSKNGFGAYTGFKPFFYSAYQVAFAGDAEFMPMMERCYGKSASTPAAGNVEMPAVDAVNAMDASPTPKAVKAAPSEPIDSDTEEDWAETEGADNSERCWQDYCPCDTSNPDYGGMDVPICRNLRGGISVDDQMMSVAAASRDARRQLREFERDHGKF